MKRIALIIVILMSALVSQGLTSEIPTLKDSLVWLESKTSDVIAAANNASDQVKETIRNGAEDSIKNIFSEAKALITIYNQLPEKSSIKGDIRNKLSKFNKTYRTNITAGPSGNTISINTPNYFQTVKYYLPIFRDLHSQCQQELNSVAAEKRQGQSNALSQSKQEYDRTDSLQNKYEPEGEGDNESESDQEPSALWAGVSVLALMIALFALIMFFLLNQKYSKLRSNITVNEEKIPSLLNIQSSKHNANTVKIQNDVKKLKEIVDQLINANNSLHEKYDSLVTANQNSAEGCNSYSGCGNYVKSHPPVQPQPAGPSFEPLYGQGATTGSTLRKVSTQQNAQDIFKIERISETEGDLQLAPSTTDMAMTVIQNRQNYLPEEICRIRNNSGTSRLVVVNPGYVRFNGGEWVVTKPVEIDIL